MAKRTRRRSRSRRKRQRGGNHDDGHEPDDPVDEHVAPEGGGIGSLLGGKRRKSKSKSKSKCNCKSKCKCRKGNKKTRRTRKKSKSRKGKKRPLNAYFKLMLNAKKKGLASFKYKGKTYKGKKHNRLGMIYRKA